MEVFPGQGHNIHDLTRKIILNRLWQDNQNEFITLSQRLAEYFFTINQNQEQINQEPEIQIEWLYHLIVVDKEWKNDEFWNLAQNWVNNFRTAELESLISALFEQITTNRVGITAQAEVHYWAGKSNFRAAETFQPLWDIVCLWQCYFYITDGWKVYASFIDPGDHIISKTYMTRVEGENTRLRHYLARLQCLTARNNYVTQYLRYATLAASR